MSAQLAVIMDGACFGLGSFIKFGTAADKARLGHAMRGRRPGRCSSARKARIVTLIERVENEAAVAREDSVVARAAHHPPARWPGGQRQRICSVNEAASEQREMAPQHAPPKRNEQCCQADGICAWLGRVSIQRLTRESSSEI